MMCSFHDKCSLTITLKRFIDFIDPKNLIESQKSDGGAIHRASNYPEMPRYCCLVKI